MIAQTEVTDIEILDNGSVVMLCPLTPEAQEWFDENVVSEPWQWIGRGLAVEPGYAPHIVEAAREDGLSI